MRKAKDIFYQLGSIASSYDTDGIDLRFLNNDHADGYDLRVSYSLFFHDEFELNDDLEYCKC